MSTTDPAADADLLAAFARTRSEAAFAELVQRHGPLVRGVCRRVLGDTPEADDAFQAVFLVLARKAGRLRDPGRVGPFLYGVAVRAAGKAKAARQRRQRRERPMGEVPAPDRDASWADVRPVLDAELAGLPAKLRDALVLCELQGVGRDEAAARLGVPAGTLSSRLARAKDALRARLIRRGLALSAAGLVAVLSEAGAASAVPAEVVHDTAAAAAAVSPKGGSLVGKLVLMLLAATGLTVAGVGLVPGDKQAGDDPALVGRWRVTEVWFNGARLGEKAELAGRSVTVTGDRIVFHGAKSGREGADLADDSRYMFYPRERPPQMDVVPEEGRDAGRKLEGVYRRDGDTLTLHFAGRSANRRSERRPVDFDCRADGGTTLVVLKREAAKPDPKPDPVAAEKAKLRGKWRVVSAVRSSLPAAGQEVRTADLWFRIDGDDLEMNVPVPNGPPLRHTHRLSYDPSHAPKRLDWTHLATAERVPQPPQLGVYELAGDRLVWALGERGQPRPTGLAPAADEKAIVFTLQRVAEAPPDTAAADRAKLQGRWRMVGTANGERLTVLPSDPGVVEIIGDRLTILTRPGGVSGRREEATYTLDPTRPVKRIDLVRTEPPGPDGKPYPMPGMYELDGDTLRLAMGRPTDPRPTKFERTPGDRYTRMYLLEREGPPAGGGFGRP